jgi:preprotein translocase subunit SecF
MVGPKVGKDLQSSAIWATVIALVFLLIYMAFRFTFTMGLGAIFCLVHDLIIVYGFFVWTGKEFNLTILAAMLTVIGYDINDTIVVCDRIRENLKSMKKQPLIEIMNSSINQTLSRTILTSCFTLLSVIAFLIFGTHILQDFAWALIVGILFGTYSSIFVASPLVLELDRFMPVKRG